jgi:hypothetical protein
VRSDQFVFAVLHSFIPTSVCLSVSSDVDPLIDVSRILLRCNLRIYVHLIESIWHPDASKIKSHSELTIGSGNMLLSLLSEVLNGEIQIHS